MSQKRTTLQVAQKLVNHLPKEMDDELKRILLHAKEGRDSEAEYRINNLLSPHENIRLWMKEQTGLMDEQKGTRLEYGRPAGAPASVRARWKWSCPVAGCLESYPVIQEGEDAPMCDVHWKRMVRADQ